MNQELSYFGQTRMSSVKAKTASKAAGKQNTISFPAINPSL
jgi:hypothetical protein